jgi:hypothetical protein
MEFQIVTTFIIGMTTAYIAWRHWWTDELKRKHDLHDRRLRIYNALIGFLENFENANGTEFLQQVRESHFIFSEEIPNYLSEVYQKWQRYKVLKGIFADPSSRPDPNNPDFAQQSEEIKQLGWWLHTQSPIATEKFKKEMQLDC